MSLPISSSGSHCPTLQDEALALLPALHRLRLLYLSGFAATPLAALQRLAGAGPRSLPQAWRPAPHADAREPAQAQQAGVQQQAQAQAQAGAPSAAGSGPWGAPGAAGGSACAPRSLLRYSPSLVEETNSRWRAMRPSAERDAEAAAALRRLVAALGGIKVRLRGVLWG